MPHLHLKCFLWDSYSAIIAELLGWKASAWIVDITILLAAAAFCLTLASRTSFLSKYANNQENTLRMLPAISLVFTPSSGGWPSQFASYFRYSRIKISHSGQRVFLKRQANLAAEYHAESGGFNIGWRTQWWRFLTPTKLWVVPFIHLPYIYGQRGTKRIPSTCKCIGKTR